MRRTAAVVAAAAVAVVAGWNVARGAGPALRPPSVPLVTHNPNFSIWSNADRLTDRATQHWTKRDQPLVSLMRVDGKSYRLMGSDPAGVDPLPQVGTAVVTPTRSVYEFDGAGVHVTLTFTTPVLPDDLDVLSRPVTYLTWSVRSTDGGTHAVQVFDSTSSQLAVNEPTQRVTWQRSRMGDLTALRVGTEAQTLLKPSGDDTRVDWGYAYAVAPSAAQGAIGGSRAVLQSFVDGGKVPDHDDDPKRPRAANDDEPVLAFAIDLGDVSNTPVSRHVMVGYDEVYSIQYFPRKLRPWWRHHGMEPAGLFAAAERDYADLTERCKRFDAELMADLTKAGGERYAQVAALSYRQGLAGCGLAADANGTPLLFTKENTSNGCIATVDLIFPAAPQFLFMGPTYAKALVAPAMAYSASARWHFPFAPHDLGVYPQATGQVYGIGGDESGMMPVEESGNLLILCAAIAQMDGNADFASQWWDQLTAWEHYLEKYGLDPEDQLCTDDFMGHLAHNANLSVKAILAIAAYGNLCELRGDHAAAQKYMDLAKADAKHWAIAANDGDHSRNAFDKPGSWSQKYNLVWDKLLGYGVFPPEVAAREVAFYESKLQKFGVPLDSRTKLTKTDWSVWSATLAGDRGDFEAIVSPIWDYLNTTTARSPAPDSYVTTDVKSDGMHARPVIGGVFAKMLEDRAVWAKYAKRDTAQLPKWAVSVPPPPTITRVVPTAAEDPEQTWQYTFERPAGDWAKPKFDDAGWKTGRAGFGSPGTPGNPVGTEWHTADVWLRRRVTMPAGAHPNLRLIMSHDEDAEVYVDGVPAVAEGGYNAHYEPFEISPAARKLLKGGATVTVAVHCHQTTGGQCVDAGFADVTEPKAE